MTRDEIRNEMERAGLKNPRVLIFKPRSGPLAYELCAGPNDGRKRLSVPQNPTPAVVEAAIQQLRG